MFLFFFFLKKKKRFDCFCVFVNFSTFFVLAFLFIFLVLQRCSRERAVVHDILTEKHRPRNTQWKCRREKIHKRIVIFHKFSSAGISMNKHTRDQKARETRPEKDPMCPVP